jgi:tetratricopeptide (TPR) repeat protein
MKSPEESPLAEIRFKLAKAWQLKGKIDTAIAGYKQVLDLQPNYTPASLKLGELLLETEKLDEALAVYSQAIELNPNDGELQKRLINTFTQKNGLDATFKLYELSRIDQKELEVKTDDILCCTVVRNELLRLPYFLTYHREKGINKFFIVDNNSTDDTHSYLLSQPDVYLWNSHLSFNQANFGSAWFELLLRKYGIDHWCLIVDADELLYYPNCETKSIHHLCQQLDRKHKKAFNTVLLDMYSEQLIKNTYYTQGQNFLEVCPYFDQKFYHTKY